MAETITQQSLGFKHQGEELGQQGQGQGFGLAVTDKRMIIIIIIIIIINVINVCVQYTETTNSVYAVTSYVGDYDQSVTFHH